MSLSATHVLKKLGVAPGPAALKVQFCISKDGALTYSISIPALKFKSSPSNTTASEIVQFIAKISILVFGA